jgi:hypothetical protein
MSEASTTGSPLTVVLVHGAFDGSSWAGVIERLVARGYQVVGTGEPAARDLDRFGVCQGRVTTMAAGMGRPT